MVKFGLSDEGDKFATLEMGLDEMLMDVNQTAYSDVKPELAETDCVVQIFTAIDIPNTDNDIIVIGRNMLEHHYMVFNNAPMKARQIMKNKYNIEIEETLTDEQKMDVAFIHIHPKSSATPGLAVYTSEDAAIKDLD